MNTDKSTVKTYAVKMILPKPGDVPLKEWTKIVMHLNKFMP